MSTNRKKTFQNLYIILGLLLIIVGVSGVVMDQFKPQGSNSDGMYIGPMKPTKSTPVVATTVGSPTPENPPIEPTAAPTPSTSLIDSFSPKSYFVQTGQNLPIENPTIPDRIVIPSINLDAPVVAADFNFLNLDGETFGQWQAPSMYAAGWHPNTALLGKVGNTVINGHHNEFGEVFGGLVNVKVGDYIYVYSRGREFSFVVANRMILPERFQPLAVRLENARWINPTDDVRLTLITCWPKESNTHRLILVARPVANP